MAIGAGAAGAWAATNATTHTVTLPAHSTGDMLLVIGACKAATITSVDPSIAEAGWNRLTVTANRDGSLGAGNGTGSVHQAVWYKVATSGSETNPTITWGGSQTAAPGIAVGLGFTKGAGEAWETPAYTGGQTTNATSISLSIVAGVTTVAGDWGVVIHTTRDDSALTVPSWTQTGLTLGTAVVYPTTPIATGTSNDMAGTTAYRSITSGPGSGNLTLSATQAAAETGVTGWVRLRVSAAGTNADAELASGTGAANTASVSLSPSTVGLASGTGGAPNAVVVTGIATNSGVATGSGAGNNAAPAVAPVGGLASGTGAANAPNPSVAPNAGLAAGIGSSGDIDAVVAGAPNLATGTGAANVASVAIAVNTGLGSFSVGEIEFVSRAAAGTSTVALPTFVPGDVAIVSAFRSGSTVPPTVPGTFTTIDASTGANTCSQATGYRILQSGDTSIGTWTNATNVQVLVFRNAHPVDPVGAATQTGASGDQLSYPALTLQDATGKSWVLGVAGHRTATNVGSQAVTGTTTRSTGSTTIGAHTDEDVTAFASTNYDGVVNASSGWRSTAIEILARGASGNAYDATVSVATSTNVNAELAVGTGTAYDADAQPAKTVDAGLAAGTGTANSPTPAVAATVTLAAGAGSAGNATVTTTAATNAAAGVATGTGTAHNPAPAVGANAGQGTGSGAAGAIDAATAGAPNVATGTGNASGPSVAIAVNVALASGSGTAYNATASTASTTDAAAGLASGTGVANGSNPAVAPNTGTGSGTGVAGDLDIAIAVNALLASGTGTANGATVSTTAQTQASADVAAGTGAANAASCNIAPTAGLGTGSGAAHNVTTTASKLADAGVATGTGLARNASVLAASAPNIATGTGTANGVDAAIATTGGVAAGTGQANQGAAALSGQSGVASGSGVAGAPAPAIGSRPGFGSGTGAAHDPTVAVTGNVSVNAGVATGSGVAWPAFALGYTPPTESEWTNKAVQYLGRKTYAMADVARGYGRAYNAYVRWDDDELAMILLLAQ